MTRKTLKARWKFQDARFASCSIAAALLAVLATVTGAAEPGAPAPLQDLLARVAPLEEGEAVLEGARRRGAIRFAARSWGSQSGLARRSWEISRMLETHAEALSRVYRFRALVDEADGFVLVPPVASETGAALRVSADGRTGVSARRLIRILRHARIATAPPDWRDWLTRDWAEPQPPQGPLWPRTDEERGIWQEALRDGWREGVRLAEDTFLSDLARLERDFSGMVAWRLLRLQGIATAPELDVKHASVVGGGKEMTLDERRVFIRKESRLDPAWTGWVAPVPGEGR